MLKILLKKQFLELGASYFRSKRINAKNNKISTIGFGILLGFLYVSLCMAFVGIGVMYIQVLEPLDIMWMYFSLFGITLIVGGTFITMFYSFSILYNAKDNELLLSLPIKTKDIVLSRLAVLYFNTLIYTSCFWLPACAVYFIRFGSSLKLILIAIILWLFLSLIVLVLASFIGYLIASISKRFKANSYVTTILSICFLGAYFYIYSNISKYINQLMEHIREVEIFVRENLGFFYLIGKASTGGLLEVLEIVLIASVLTLICFVLINKNFGSIIKDSNSAVKTKNKKIEVKQNSVSNALINKELNHFLSNSTYTLNCGLGTILLLGGSVALIIYKNNLLETIETLKMFMPIDKMLPALLLAVVAGISSMNALATPAVSLEGNTYWITRSLPVSTYEILNAKRMLQYRLNVIPSILFIIVSTFIFKIEGLAQILLILSMIIFLSFVSYWDLFLGIKGANLNWTSEIIPIKQSINVLIAVFSSFFFMFIVGYGYYMLLDKISVEIYLEIVMIISVLLVKLLDNWLRTKGVIDYENL